MAYYVSLRLGTRKMLGPLEPPHFLKAGLLGLLYKMYQGAAEAFVEAGRCQESVSRSTFAGCALVFQCILLHTQDSLHNMSPSCKGRAQEIGTWPAPRHATLQTRSKEQPTGSGCYELICCPDEQQGVNNSPEISAL